MLEIYSKAIINNCYFEGNEAADNGGAIFIKIRSHIIFNNSIFNLNKANNNGGSILVHHSKIIVLSCKFVNESVVFGYGGAISTDNVANVTVQESSFYNCTALYGGFVSLKFESVLNIEHSTLSHNCAIQEGGAVYVFQNSFVIGSNITVANGKSMFGAAISVHDSSELNLNIFNFLRSTVNESGGPIYCQKSKVVMERGDLLENDAKLDGGGIFADHCHLTCDHSKILNNTALMKGGGIYLKSSTLEIHNTEGDNNSAGFMGNFGFITESSKFESNYLYLAEATENCIVIFNNSEADMKYTYLSNLKGHCPLVAKLGSDIFIDSIYLTDLNFTRQYQEDLEYRENVVCRDRTSNAKGTIEGISAPFFCNMYYLCVFLYLKFIYLI